MVYMYTDGPRDGAPLIDFSWLPTVSVVSEEEHLRVALEYARKVLETTLPIRPELRDALLARVPSDLSDDDRDVLSRCLLDNADVFALDSSEMGCTNWMRMRIRLKPDVQPVAIQPYRLSLLSLVEHEADGMCSHDCGREASQGGRAAQVAHGHGLLSVERAHRRGDLAAGPCRRSRPVHGPSLRQVVPARYL